jgi:hypothetical protein
MSFELRVLSLRIGIYLQFGSWDLEFKNAQIRKVAQKKLAIIDMIRLKE